VATSSWKIRVGVLTSNPGPVPSIANSAVRLGSRLPAVSIAA
jgi:hypothetical protein